MLSRRQHCRQSRSEANFTSLTLLYGGRMEVLARRESPQEPAEILEATETRCLAQCDKVLALPCVDSARIGDYRRRPHGVKSSAREICRSSQFLISVKIPCAELRPYAPARRDACTAVPAQSDGSAHRAKASRMQDRSPAGPPLGNIEERRSWVHLHKKPCSQRRNTTAYVIECTILTLGPAPEHGTRPTLR